MNLTPRIAVAVLVAAMAALAGMWLARQASQPPPALEHATVFPEARALPDFLLVDQHGKPFGRRQLAGQWSILFFGFTHCPDVCPGTLATLAAARRALADLPPAEQPAVVLVSVDPGRDTPASLAEYLGFFDPSFTGLSGQPGALELLTRELGVAVIIGEPDANGSYTVDHTAALFLVDPDGALAAVFGMPHTPEGIAHDYRLILGQSGRRRG